MALPASINKASGTSIPDQRDGWTPTGRIDFSDLDSTGSLSCKLRTPEIVGSIGGVEHREIRRRKATLDEAKTVVVAYHAQRNLAVAANYVVSSRAVMRPNSSPKNEHQETPLGKNETFDVTPQSQTVI